MADSDGFTSDDFTFDDEPEESLEEVVDSLTVALRLTPDEREALLLMGGWLDDIGDMFGAAMEQCLQRDSAGRTFAYLDEQVPLIVAGMRAEASAHRDDVARLAQGRFAEAVVGLGLGRDEFDVHPLCLQILTDALEPLAPHRAKVAFAYMRGRVADRMGRGLEAEADFERAVGLDPTWGPALEWLATMASDRGDAVRALSLLDRAGVGPDDGQYQMLTSFLPSNVVSLRRNDPCWCGSGRKLKVCHREGESLPLGTRALWLFQKAARFVNDGPFRADLLELASERARYGGQRELIDALADPLVVSAVMFEGLGLQMFAETRGPLLPPDELALLNQWLRVRRGLYDVEEVIVDEGLHVRNVLTGGRVFVHEVLGSRSVHVGMLFVSVVLPRGDGTFGFFGGFEPISFGQRESVIDLLDEDADPFDVVAAMTDRFAPTQLVTKEGDLLEEVITVISVKGRRSLPKAFDAQFTRVADTEWLAGVDGGPTREFASIGGRLDVDGRLVTVTTMSRARMDLLLDVIEGLGLEFSIVSESAVNIAEAVKSRADVEDDAPSMDDPEVQAVLAEYVANYEREWLDMDIPALGGLTPRQAAADPIVRLDLIALLNSFPTGIPNSMDANRLRAALGLE